MSTKTLMVARRINHRLPLKVCVADFNGIVTDSFLLRFSPLHALSVAIVMAQRQMPMLACVEDELYFSDGHSAVPLKL